MMRFTVILLLFCSFSNLFGQSFSTHFAPRERGWTTFGIDGGLAYQSADVKTCFQGWGAGMTLGKNLAYRPGGLFSFDIRGRALFTRSYGADWQANFDIKDNTALNGTYRPGINYLLDQSAPSDSSFVFANYRTGMGELGAEGVLTFNRLRERTGVVLSLFGGIGLDAYRVRIDQANASGNIYNYLSVDRSRGEENVTNQLERLRDGVYESRADGSTNTGIRLGWMPGAGVELGYQLGRRFVVGVGHKITFSRTDVLDGQRWTDAGIAANDWAHYTNLHLRWDIERRAPRLHPPIIDITFPERNPYITEDANVFVRANIRHVRSSVDVRCYLNGESRGFEFRNEKFGTNVRLRPGRNELRIEAFNPEGSDEETLVIFWEERRSRGSVPPPPPPPPPAVPLPSVEITTPSSSPFAANQPDLPLRAQIQHVNDQRDIRLTVNGVANPFNWRTPLLDADIRLRPGRNVIRVEAVNPAGTGADEVIVELGTTPPPPPPGDGRRPQVRILQPAGTTATTEERSYPFKATVTNVSSRDEITLLLNGRSVRDFEYSPRSGDLTARLDLSPNENPVVLRARNSLGEAEATVNITRKNAITPPPPPAPKPPVVRINEPTNGAVFNIEDVAFSAVTEQVNQRNEVVLVLNGRTVADFDFNTATGRISGRMRLKPGDNTLTIRVSNSVGKDEASVRVRYEAPTPPPVVNILAPSNGSETKEPNGDFRATATHVRSKSDLQLFQNGNALTQFDWNERSGQVSATLVLSEGENRIRLSAKNASGSDEKTVTVRYTPKKAPTVTITAPADRSRVSVANTQLVAQVNHVFSAQNVTVSVNGVETRQFNMDRSGRLTASITLKEGENKLSVAAKTPDGQAQAAVSVVYAVAVPKPVVTFIQPGLKTRPVATPAFTFKAKVTSVSSADDIQATLNGKAIKMGKYDPETQEYTFNANLASGKNTAKISAQNSAGSASATAEVTYTPPGGGVAAQAPEVAIQSASQPTVDPFNPNTAKSSVFANLKNVSGKDQVTVLLNGKAFTDFQFDAKTGKLNCVVPLQRGKNTIVVSASTPAGSAEDTATVNW